MRVYFLNYRDDRTGDLSLRELYTLVVLPTKHHQGLRFPVRTALEQFFGFTDKNSLVLDEAHFCICDPNGKNLEPNI